MRQEIKLIGQVKRFVKEKGRVLWQGEILWITK